ncbi:MAG TPA: GNAT family N-acetyltransferase [Candidatus Acidoferrum sp.]|nr:GNAT family N-acetyltransferase [Candidatus Acidoferrum sp.]
MTLTVWRAAQEDLETAYKIVEEYYEAAGVVARDSFDEFARLYFCDGVGVWLARNEDSVIGCIALRALPEYESSGEIKRLYVQTAHRKAGVAQSLLENLEAYAVTFGYQWLYLDSAPGMDDAVRFYRRNGYEECSRYNNNPQATIFLRKRIASD